MSTRIPENKQFLTNLFTGPFERHGVIMDHGYGVVDWSDGDFTTSAKPIAEWIPLMVRLYEQRMNWHEQTGDDSVPIANLISGTQLFADAYGCDVHIYPNNIPCALPLVTTAQQADALPEPSLNARCLDRVFEMAAALQQRLGKDAIIAVPDVQSPLDIAALIWRKEDMFPAMYEEPESVSRLIDKCRRLVEMFTVEFLRQNPTGCLSHVPYVWTPDNMGICLSEDEVGSISTAMFEQFAAPSLNKLSERFGGLFIHCCATADHQYENFTRLKNLRGMNRMFQTPGPLPAIQAFENKSVLMLWTDEATVQNLLRLAMPGTRYLFNQGAGSVDDAKAIHARLRELIARA